MNELLHFEEESRLVPSPEARATPETAAIAGSACGKAAGGRILVAHSGERGAASLAACFAAGAASAGADCLAAGICPATAAAYAAKSLKCAMSCYVHTELTASFKLTAADGLSLFADTEEKIEKGLCGDFIMPYSHYGSVSGFNGAQELYSAYLDEKLGGKFKGIYADISSPSASVTGCCERILSKRNDRNGIRIAFHISGDGSKVSAYSEETGYIFGEKLIMICCRDLFERGVDAAVCGRPSHALERLAERYGRKVLSCGRGVCRLHRGASKECISARALASEQLFMHDGIALAMTVLEIMTRKNTTLRALTDSLPSFAHISRYIPVNRPSELLKRLCTPGYGDGYDDGLLKGTDSERVTIRPVRTGKGIMLNVECFETETAAELCDLYTGMIKEAVRQYTSEKDA